MSILSLFSVLEKGNTTEETDLKCHVNTFVRGPNEHMQRLRAVIVRFKHERNVTRQAFMKINADSLSSPIV